MVTITFLKIAASKIGDSISEPGADLIKVVCNTSSAEGLNLGDFIKQKAKKLE